MGSSGTGKSFSVAENERLRGLARGMLEKADNNQRRLADILGVAQPTVSNFIAGKTGAGVQLEIAEEARTLREAMRVQPHADPWLLRAQLRRARLIDAA